MSYSRSSRRSWDTTMAVANTQRQCVSRRSSGSAEPTLTVGAWHDGEDPDIHHHCGVSYYAPSGMWKDEV